MPLLRTERSFLRRTPQQTPNMLFSWPDNPKIVPFVVDLDPYVIHGSLDSRESALNGISIVSNVFAQHIRVISTQTNTQTTLRVISLAIIGRILCTACVRCGLVIQTTVRHCCAKISYWFH